MQGSGTAYLHNHFSNILSTIGSFELKPMLAVAVSGGSDSMALLLMAHDWSKQQGGKAIALTIDHGLRQESAREANQVAAWCKTLGIDHHILVWEGSKPAAGKQEAARNARYALLSEWCRNNNVPHLFTAHHLEDQGETLLFRLARGSGIKGLACIPLVSMLDGIRLIRPLLGNTKQELQNYLIEKKQPWLEDPSNQNMVYTRNIIRKNLAGTDLAARAGTIANHFGKIRNLLESNIVSYLTKTISTDAAGFITFKKSVFQALPEMAGVDILSCALAHVSGDDAPIRNEPLHALYHGMLRTGDFKKSSLSGCLITYRKKNDLFTISREPAAIDLPLTLMCNNKALWDGRFTVYFSATQSCSEVLTVRKLGVDGLSHINRDALPPEYTTLPAHIFYTFPAFWRLEELLAVPHIGYVNPRYAHIQCFACFTPAKALAAHAFYGMNNNSNFLTGVRVSA